MASAGSSFFENVIVLSLRGGMKRGSFRQHRQETSSVFLLYAVNFVRGMLYPLADIFDPIKFLVLLVHGFILSKRYKPSCIFASMPPLETGLSAWLLSKRRGSILVIDLRDDWESAAGMELRRFFPVAMFNVLTTITNKVYSSAFVIFATTQTIADKVRRRGIATPTILAPNGADTSVFVPKSESLRVKIRMKYSLPLDKVIAVYSGSGTSYYYRLDKVLASVKFLFKGVKERMFIVFYVYDGSDKLKEKIRGLRIKDNILDVRDPLPRRSLAEVLAVCDVGLLPFDDKEFLLCARSTKLYEYLSSGLYVISSGPRGGELDELFSGSPAFGSFIQPSAGDFAASISGILKTKENLFSENLRKLRHSFIERNYDRKTIMKTAVKALLESLKSNADVNCIQNRDKR